MNLKRLTQAAAGAALLLTATPALAGARPGLGHRRANALPGCRLSLIAEPHRVTAGDETPQLFGKLTCASGIETAGQTITISARSVAHPLTELGTATTSTGGYYSYIAPAPALNTEYVAAATGVRSAKRQVRVAPQVSLSGPTETHPLYTGVANRVSFSGTVSPSAGGAPVVLQREAATADEEWVTIQHSAVSAGGSFDLVHTFVIPGDANIRVLVRARGYATVAGASTSLSYVISQKENPQLTLVAASTSASSDPIFYGQPLMLSGTVAGASGAKQTVTLDARTAHGLFEPVASSVTGATGQYSFPQTPQQDTAYRVLAGNGARSSVLFEGVKYVLTAASSAGSAQAGQTVTFSGTVTPYQAGHAVYLERQDASGIGYHVVAVGALSAPAAGSSTASYSIPFTVFGTGKQVYRVKVPGDPDNQGTASTTFTVEVSPAPAQSLRPAPPVKVPTEGSV